MRQQQQQQQQYNGRGGYPQQGQFQQGQWGGGGMGGYGVAQQQGAMPAYQAAAGFQPGYGQQTPAAAAGSAGQANFQQQQWQQQQQGQYGQQQQQQQGWGQQQMGWGQEQSQQWAGQHGWAGGAAGAASPRATATATNPNMYPMAPQQQQQQQQQPLSKPDAGKRVEAQKAAGEGMQSETYQRTLEYVQQCQSWSSPTNPDYTGVMSPDSSSVNGGWDRQAEELTEPHRGYSGNAPTIKTTSDRRTKQASTRRGEHGHRRHVLLPEHSHGGEQIPAYDAVEDSASNTLRTFIKKSANIRLDSDGQEKSHVHSQLPYTPVR